MAPRTSAVNPVPQPKTRPQSKNNCHNCVTVGANAIAIDIKQAAVTMILRKPNLAIKIAAKGPSKPNSAKRTANTDDN
jgi:hypothetical protein